MSKKIESHLKSAVAIVGISFLTTALTGCHHFFGNDRQTKDPLQLKEQGLSCIRSVGQDLQSYFSGGPEDPVLIIDCISGAMAKFANSTRGANPDGWTRSELSSFFETYFRAESGQTPSAPSPAESTTATPDVAANVPVEPSVQIAKNDLINNSNSPKPFDTGWMAQAKRRAIVGELFKWKATLLGGGDQTISRAEVERIRAVLAGVREPIAVIRGRGALLSFHRSTFSPEFEGPSASEIEKIVASLRAISKVLANELKRSGSELKQPRDDMKFDAMAQSLEKSGIKSLAGNNQQELAKLVKVILVGGESSRISGEEWALLVDQAVEVWISAIRILFGFNDFGVLESLIKDSGAVLFKIVERHGGRVDTDLLKRFVSQLEVNRLLPSAAKARSINGSMEMILGKLLAGNSHPQKTELMRGFMREHVIKLDQIARDWLEGERVALEITGPAGVATIQQARVTMSQIATRARDPIAAAARAQFSDLILRSRPLVYDPHGRLVILPENQLTGFRHSDLRRLNFARTHANVVLRAFAYEPSRAGAVPLITDAEAQEAFLDLKSIGRDAGIMDVRSLNSGTRTFMEAGVFLSVSDGDQFISLAEGVEWFSMIVSAGHLADVIHSDLLQTCGTNPPDVFGKQRIKAKCFRDGALAAFRVRLSHLPHVSRAINKADRDGTFPKLLHAIERAARPLGESDLPIESSELRTIPPILQYAESLFVRHDSNQSSLLDQAEVWGIFPLIRPFIRSMAGVADLSDGEERAIFSWMLKYGEPPKTTLIGKALLKAYQGRMALGLTNEQATVADVVKILASFNELGREKKNKELVEYYVQNAKAWEAGLAKSDEKTIEQTRNLMQCSSEADTDLARVFVARRSEIFKVDGNLDADAQALEFVKRAKLAVQSDPQLQLLCGAF